MAPHPDVQDRVNAREARLHRLESAAASNNNSGSHTDEESFWNEITETFKAIQDNFKTLNARLKILEERPQLKYHGVWQSGVIYAENSLVTREGSLWIARKTTAAFPGGPTDPEAWQLTCKRGNDGKDAR